MKNINFAGLSTRERRLLSHFASLEKDTLTVNDLIKLRDYKAGTANQILSRLSRKGWLQRLKRGVYSIVPLSSITAAPAIEKIWPLAVDLFKPAFISGWSSAEHWDLTEQIFNSVAIVTSLPQRKNLHVIGDIKFRTKTINKKLFFGTTKIWFGSSAVEIADPSRTLVDILDVPSFGGGGRHVIDVVNRYWRSDTCNPDLLFKYALQYDRGVLFKRLGYLAEKQNAPVDENWIKACQKHTSKGISNFDPDGPKVGKIITKWNLRINLPIVGDDTKK